jgi:hypothetical protein
MEDVNWDYDACLHSSGTRHLSDRLADVNRLQSHFHFTSFSSVFTFSECHSWQML